MFIFLVLECLNCPKHRSRGVKVKAKLAHHRCKLCFLKNRSTLARKLRSSRPQPDNPRGPQPLGPLSKSCFIKATAHSFQVAAKPRRVSQKENNTNKCFVQVCETRFAAQESLRPPGGKITAVLCGLESDQVQLSLGDYGLFGVALSEMCPSLGPYTDHTRH